MEQGTGFLVRDYSFLSVSIINQVTREEDIQIYISRSQISTRASPRYKAEASSFESERDKNLDSREEKERGKERITSPEMRVSRIVLRAASSAGIRPRVYRPLYTEKDHY